MDFELTLPPAAQAIAPILISAPGSHSGTALLQRLINAGENGLCYGDNLFEEVLSSFDWATSLIEQHSERRALSDEALSAVMARRPTTWMPDFGPEFTQHMSSIFSVIYNVPHLSEHYAQEQGRDVWGMIRTEVPAPLMSDLLSVFPNGKAIFIHRNPFDIANELLIDRPEVDITGICEAWALNMNGYLRFNSDRLLKLRYEDATDDPARFMEKLTALTGIKGLDMDGAAPGREAELDDARELSPEEQQLIRSTCEDMLNVFYPELV